MIHVEESMCGQREWISPGWWTLAGAILVTAVKDAAEGCPKWQTQAVEWLAEYAPGLRYELYSGKQPCWAMSLAERTGKMLERLSRTPRSG
jgi:hypothetical protein